MISCSLTQKALAEDLRITRQPIGKFFTGKPVDRNLFVQICDRLDLEWEEIIAEPASEPEVNQDNSIDIDAIVQEVREKIKPSILERCGTMRVLDITQPIGLNDIYTSVNILEKITGQQRLGINELFQECTKEDFDRFTLTRITAKRVPGLEAVEKYSKLMILGKPGAGKTTFLKYLAIQCIGGEFQAERVPIFVTLKNFAEIANKPGLLQYIREEARNPISSIEDVLTYGKALVLLDGLDEVREEDSNRVLKEIREFSDRFPKNQFVMTCRIAAKEYTFEKFTEVEVADFDDGQIFNFTNNWFKDKAVKPEIFIKGLEENNRIKQLAASPLLLTLLCLAFEESGDFPANRSELYKEGLDALLKKWDAKRGIQRYQIYKKLSVQRKEDLLSKIALTTFEQSDYFFKQKAAEQYIIEYIRNLPDANTDPEILQLESEVVLHSIEAQHGLLVERAKGIYSFSHLTFHEYFTDREIVIVQQSSEEALQNL
ncbi:MULTISPECIES: NACHT domain-containing protein [unclassified Nostoc]|uniref:NACHT domain-containing protein n=1 Tax=unclassified Nostoc TaxID=2593658 RepID=UPI00263783E7|nr:NACHT domain-containing protein [Nostoc sp. S13]